MASYSFGYLNFAVVSGSHYSPSDPNPNIIPPAILGGTAGARTFPGVINFVPQGATTTITESLTIEYFHKFFCCPNPRNLLRVITPPTTIRNHYILFA